MKIKFENTKVYNIARAVYSARNPMDSWNKSDSDIEHDLIGENDLALAQKLIKAGSEHRKFLRQIFVTVDITAPRYWWAEFDTYKIGTTANSCSTMHKLKDYPFTPEMFAFDYDDMSEETMIHVNDTINYLEHLRKLYNTTKDIKYFRDMKQALPESFLQRRTVTMNYENILTMIKQRKTHRLKEWAEDFMNWIKALPYANEFFFEPFEEIKILYSNKNTCVCCGNTIPEGMQVCLKCRKLYNGDEFTF